MKKPLSIDQERTLRFLASSKQQPSYREIASMLGKGYHPTTVKRILSRLQQKGFIMTFPREARSVLVLRLPKTSVAA